MACNDAWLEIVSAWHDGEATPDEVARVRAHLDGCAECRLDRSRFRLLGDALRSAERDRRPDRTSPTTMLRPGRGRLIAAALVAAAAVLVVVPRGARDGNRVVVDELEARHLTAFAKAAPCDFESADPAAVHAWIAEKFGQEVEVPTVPGARLLGARSCSLSGATTVSLMYRRGDEPLSLFVSPPKTATAVENARLARGSAGCTVARLGAAVCARQGLFAVSETAGSAMAALEAN